MKPHPPKDPQAIIFILSIALLLLVMIPWLLWDLIRFIARQF